MCVKISLSSAPGDYTAQVNTSVTIEGTSATVLVEIVADDVTEGEESFSVFLLLPEMIVPRVRLGDRSRATVIIGDPGQSRIHKNSLSVEIFFN